MRFLLRVPFALLFWVMSAALVLSFIDQLKVINLSSLIPLGVGPGAYFIFLFVLSLLNRSIEFAQTFCHELNHTFFSLLFFKKIKGFRAHADNGGEVSFEGKTNIMITLAPYSVPLFAVLTLLLLLLAEPRVVPAIHFVVGFFISFHLHSVFSEFRLYQSDLRVYGIFLSFAFVVFVNLLFLLWIISVSADDFSAGFHFLKHAFFSLRDVGMFLVDKAMAVVK